MAERLFDYATAVLANVNTIWQTASVPLPEFQYVAPGPFDSVSFDCEQVTVTVDLISRGAPGAPTPGYVRLGECSATITVAIIHLCMPTSETLRPPPAADQAAAAAIVFADLDLMWRNTKEILNALGCTQSGLQLVKPIEIQGSAGGAQLTGTVDLLAL